MQQRRNKIKGDIEGVSHEIYIMVRATILPSTLTQGGLSGESDISAETSWRTELEFSQRVGRGRLRGCMCKGLEEGEPAMWV